MPDKPVLFLIFNRPDTTARVFETIRQARPSRLYVAADGARSARPGDDRLCAEARRIATAIDWPCELHTLFRDENLGCKQAVSSAIDWFFENEEEGIILEDDCLPHPDFFSYCAALLERYRDDPGVMCISGASFAPWSAQDGPSYRFTRLPFIWGWATWRRAWSLYDSTMSSYASSDRKAVLKDLLGPGLPGYVTWRLNFDRVVDSRFDTWDFQWVYACLANNGLTCVPAANLISNIGFNEHGTHTRSREQAIADMPTGELGRELIHPETIKSDPEFDARIERLTTGVRSGIGFDILRRYAKIMAKDLVRRFR